MIVIFERTPSRVIMAATVGCQEKTSGNMHCLNKKHKNSFLTGESIFTIKNGSKGWREKGLLFFYLKFKKKEVNMADFYINVFLDDAKLKQVEEAGVADQVTEIDGKKAIQVGMTKKDKKKLLKGYDGCTFDDSNACVLPEDGEDKLMAVISEVKTLDCMKFAIMKLYNPLAGRGISGRGSAGR